MVGGYTNHYYRNNVVQYRNIFFISFFLNFICNKINNPIYLYLLDTKMFHYNSMNTNVLIGVYSFGLPGEFYISNCTVFLRFHILFYMTKLLFALFLRFHIFFYTTKLLFALSVVIPIVQHR